MIVIIFVLEILLQPFAAELAGGAMAAAIARDAVVAGERLLAYEVEDAQPVGQRPCLGFVQPHQRRVNHKLLVYAEVERYVERFDERVSAVGVTAVIRLAHARYEVGDAALAGVDGGDGEEEQVSSGHECVGRAVLRFLLIHGYSGVGERVAPQMTDEGHVHLLPVEAGFAGDRLGHLHFLHVFLPIDEREGVDFLKMLLGPKEAGGGVLSTAKHHEGLVFVYVVHDLVCFYL